MRGTRRQALCAHAVVVVGLVGCGALHPASSAPADEDASAVRGAVIPVLVQNDNMQDVNIYLLHGGMRTRIGIAGAAQATTFTFPVRYSAGAVTVQLAAVPLIGGRTGWRRSVTSDPIVVHGGQRIVYSLEPDLAHSTIAVYAMEPVLDSADTTHRAPATEGSGPGSDSLRR